MTPNRAKFPVLFPVILRLNDDPKILAANDAKIVGDSVAEAAPVLGYFIAQEVDHRSANSWNVLKSRLWVMF